MNWILFGVIFILAQHKDRHKSTELSFGNVIGIRGLAVVATPIPLPNDPFLISINPYIRHWEAARFDIDSIKDTRHQHDVERRRRRRRRKRDSNSTASSSQRFDADPTNSITFQFFAHNRQFNVILREDPNSIFSPDVQIENTLGPLSYDVSRVYTGTLEDDENAIVHGVLTENNLFDGSIITSSENYYIEPAHKYSNELNDKGVHSIVYKTSDVQMLPHLKQPSSTVTPSMSSSSIFTHDDDEDVVSGEHYCASERLRKKLKNEFKRRRKYSNRVNEATAMRRPSVSEQQYESIISDNNKSSFNKIMDEYSKRRSKRWLPDELSESQDPPLPLDLDVPYNDDYSIFSRINNRHNAILNKKPEENRKNILISSFNPNNEFILRNSSQSNTFDNNNMYGKGGNNNNTRNSSIYPNGKFVINTNSTYSRPSHKTHVEIITKNGATKKPNIIGSNYNPDVILTRTNFHHHHTVPNNNNINNNVRNDISGDNAAKSLYDRKSTCMLYLQADHTFFQKMGSEEASIEAITRHVQRANVIYKNTDFNGDGKPDNITFMIKRIKVHTSNALKDGTYRFPGNYGVEKFLEIFSEEDYDAFCLAYMFTYRDFEMGTLGLAWTGDLKNAGGVCEKNGHYRGSLKSLNTGIVTLLNYGKHVPPAVSHVTLAHEIGHNFGSPHDPEQCTPGGEDGNYIMFARATSGDKKNNNKFSPCSLKAIEPVLNAKARSNKGCFTEPQQAICGNGVVDPGEECDCGWEEDCKDSCCFPMSSHPLLDERPCTLTPRASCSPSQGPCCTTACTLKFGDRCRDDNGCRDPSFCDGHMPQCPSSINKPNKTICNKEFVCYMGECTGSICLAYGLESCQCIPTVDDPKTKACELCCKLPGEGNPCKSSFEWNDIPYDVPDMYAKPGTPCNDYNGYCDVFQKCREVDPSGPLATLRRLLLSEESIASFKKWVVNNWFTVAFVVIAVVILLILSTKLFDKRMNRKLKSITIIHSATTETVRLPEDNNGVIVHTAVRTKVPFKKKVRGERSSKSKSALAAKLKSSNKHSPSKGLIQAAAIATGSTNHAFKRQETFAEDVTQLAKKRKRSTKTATTDEQMSKTHADTSAIKANKSQAKLKSSSSKHKGIIDYSKRLTTETNAIGKVHQWLLESPVGEPTAPLKELEHLTQTRQMSKSQSTPERLAQRAPKKVKSVSNLNDKVKLQVVYKPPFKFSLKLSKNSAVKTKVIGGNAAEIMRNKRSSRVDKNRKGRDTVGNVAKTRRSALLIRSKVTDELDGGLPFTLKPNTNNTEDQQQLMPQEPNYETLNSRKDSPSYENIKNSAIDNNNGTKMASGSGTKHEPIDTATFRINKSASGTKIIANSNRLLNDNESPSNTVGSKSSGSRGSSTNINKTGTLSSHNGRNQSSQKTSSSRGSTTNLTKQFGSSQNLMRSSTTNLSKNNSDRNSFDIKRGFYDMSRSSTTNLSKDRRHGSHLNLLKHQHLRSSNSNVNSFEDITLPSTFATTSSTGTNIARSRRNSSTIRSSDSMTKTSIPRVPSNSNLKIPSLRHGGVANNNIPRASLNVIASSRYNNLAASGIQPAPMMRQTLLQPPQNTSKSSKRNSIEYPMRPHTSECNTDKHFEWPPAMLGDKLTKKDEPLPSDLEVMVSDVENLVTDDN